MDDPNGDVKRRAGVTKPTPGDFDAERLLHPDPAEVVAVALWTSRATGPYEVRRYGTLTESAQAYVDHKPNWQAHGADVLFADGERAWLPAEPTGREGDWGGSLLWLAISEAEAAHPRPVSDAKFLVELLVRVNDI